MNDTTDLVEERAALEARREFLIRSLEDLESERDAGNIDTETYERLHGDYTARAAAVLRALDGERVKLPNDAPPASAGRRTLVIGGIVGFAIAAAVVLGITIAPRLPGQTVTGGVSTSPKASAAALKNAVTQHPNDYSARIAYARYLLANDPAGAIKQYTAAANLEPKQPEPPTYIGWILALTSQQGGVAASQRTEFLTRSFQELGLAISLDPKYPDAYVFEGLLHTRFESDPKGGIPYLQKYLQLAPDGPQASLVRSELKAAQKAATSPVVATTTTTAG